LHSARQSRFSKPSMGLILHQDTIPRVTVLSNNTLIETNRATAAKDTAHFVVQKRATRTEPKSLFLLPTQTSKATVDSAFKYIPLTSNTLLDSYLKARAEQFYPDTICKLSIIPQRTSETRVYSVDGSSKKLDRFWVVERTDNRFNINESAFYFLLLALFLLSYTISVYRKYIGQFFEALIFRFVANKIIREKTVPIQKMSTLLDLVYILCFALLFNQAFVLLSNSSQPNSIMTLTLFAAAVCSFRVLRYLLVKISLLFTGYRRFFHDIYSNSILYSRVLGVILLPLVFLIAYTHITLALPLLYVSVAIFAIVMIARTVRLFLVFVEYDISIFYFILYLCALEIAPFLIVWKEAQMRQ